MTAGLCSRCEQPHGRSAKAKFCLVCVAVKAREKNVRAYARCRADPAAYAESLASQRAWYRRNAEAVNARVAAYRKANPEKAREIQRSWIERNPEKKRAKDARGYWKNAEKRRAQCRDWRRRHLQESRDRCNRWLKENPEKNALKGQRRRSRLAGLPSTLTNDQWTARWAMFGGFCAYCDQPASALDHVIPVVHGGGTEEFNVVPACKSCNSSKGSKLPLDWRPDDQIG